MIALLLALSAASSPAHSKTFAQKVADTKRAMIQDADELFIETWKSPPPEGMGADLMRVMFRLMGVGSSIGGCKEFASPSLKADWLGKMDRIGGGDDAYRDAFRERGLRLIDRGDDGAMADLTDAERKQLCAVELEAARQLLAETT